MIASQRFPATWHEYDALCFTKNSFCGFSMSDVGLYLVQSGVRVARRKELKMCCVSLKKLPVEPTKLSLKTANVIVHVTCKLVTPQT